MFVALWGGRYCDGVVLLQNTGEDGTRERSPKGYPSGHSLARPPANPLGWGGQSRRLCRADEGDRLLEIDAALRLWFRCFTPSGFSDHGENPGLGATHRLPRGRALLLTAGMPLRLEPSGKACGAWHVFSGSPTKPCAASSSGSK